MIDDILEFNKKFVESKVIAFSWAIAFFEYSCQIPANRIGFIGNGGPFSLMQLKVIQEAVSYTHLDVYKRQT